MGSLVAERGDRHQVNSRQIGEETEAPEQSRIGAIDLYHTNVALIGTLRGPR
jgi:hypothetical protein